MSDEYEWGPWVDHDGRGCTCVGEYVEVDHEYGNGLIIPKVDGRHGWNSRTRESNVIRYRIRRPRSKAMDLLRAICLDPVAPINAPTGPLRELTPA